MIRIYLLDIAVFDAAPREKPGNESTISSSAGYRGARSLSFQVKTVATQTTTFAIYLKRKKPLLLFFSIRLATCATLS